MFVAKKVGGPSLKIFGAEPLYAIEIHINVVCVWIGVFMIRIDEKRRSLKMSSVHTHAGPVRDTWAPRAC